jgi:hypothetical protein
VNSHGYFASDDQPLEDAIGRKLDAALAAVSAKPGDREPPPATFFSGPVMSPGEFFAALS